MKNNPSENILTSTEILSRIGSKLLGIAGLIDDGGQCTDTLIIQKAEAYGLSVLIEDLANNIQDEVDSIQEELNNMRGKFPCQE